MPLMVHEGRRLQQPERLRRPSAIFAVSPMQLRFQAEARALLARSQGVNETRTRRCAGFWRCSVPGLPSPTMRRNARHCGTRSPALRRRRRLRARSGDALLVSSFLAAALVQLRHFGRRRSSGAWRRLPRRLRRPAWRCDPRRATVVGSLPKLQFRQSPRRSAA